MQILTWIAYACWALAALALIICLREGDVLLFAGSVSVAISGVLFFAFERVISLLTDIRDTLQGGAKNEPEPLLAPQTDTPPMTEKPTRSLAELSADLDRLKSGLSS